MYSKKDLMILSELRSNGRQTLTEISKKTRVPISTIFDKLKQFEGNVIKQHSTLINFASLGFNIKANIMIKSDIDSRLAIKDYLINHQNVNSLYKINNGFDYMFEILFPNIRELEDFLESFDKKFKVQNKQVYYIVDDIKKESFLTDPDMLDLLINEQQI